MKLYPKCAVTSILTTFNSVNKYEITADYYYIDLHYIKEILVQLLCMFQELHFSSSLYKATSHDKERNTFYIMLPDILCKLDCCV
jgi:hypothetical protein